jgi:nitrogen fixation-related uncharacterized protein
MLLFLAILMFTAGSGQEDDDTELERLLYEISDSRHAEDRRDAMSQLANLLRGNQAVGYQFSQGEQLAAALSLLLPPVSSLAISY